MGEHYSVCGTWEKVVLELIWSGVLKRSKWTTFHFLFLFLATPDDGILTFAEKIRCKPTYADWLEVQDLECILSFKEELTRSVKTYSTWRWRWHWRWRLINNHKQFCNQKCKLHVFAAQPEQADAASTILNRSILHVGRPVGRKALSSLLLFSSLY